MKRQKERIFSLLDLALFKVVKDGESKKITFKIPYFELAQEYARTQSPLDGSMLDVKIQILISFTDEDDEEYETDVNFAIKNKTSQ